MVLIVVDRSSVADPARVQVLLFLVFSRTLDRGAIHDYALLDRKDDLIIDLRRQKLAVYCIERQFSIEPITSRQKPNAI
jgi:hypothetical protein